MEQLVCFQSSLDYKVDHVLWKENQDNRAQGHV